MRRQASIYPGGVPAFDAFVKEGKPAKKTTKEGCRRKDDIQDNVGSSKPGEERGSRRKEQLTVSNTLDKWGMMRKYLNWPCEEYRSHQ